MEGVKEVSWGYEVRTSSDSCISAINSYCHQVLSNGRENSCIFKAPKYDPQCVLANTLAAYVTFYSDRSSRPSYINDAKSNLETATPYEKAVFEAVDYLITTNDDDGTVEKHAELLREFPKDILSLKRAQVLCFFMGGSKQFLEIVEKVLPMNEGENYIHGIHAFALQEVGDDMKAAEDAGNKGYKINPDDAATHHALCHIHQHECHFRQAVDFMIDCSKKWIGLQSFMFTHNWWHVCLCYLEGGAPIKYVWEIHEEYLWKELEKPNPSRGKVYLNDIGLLLRVHIRDGYDGSLSGYESSMLRERLETLTTTLMADDLHKIWKREWFIDILLLWVLSHMKKDTEAEELLQALESKINSEEHEKKRERMKKGFLLAQASYKYGKGEYKDALKILGDDFDAVQYKVIGASGEQIDVFNEVYIDMLLKTNDGWRAMDFVDKQMLARKGAPFLWRLGEEALKVVKSELIAKGDTDDKIINFLESYQGMQKLGSVAYQELSDLK